jgi:superfamily I DNA and/or RNA helicase
MNIPDFSNKGSRHHGLNLEPFINEDVHTIWVDVDSPETKIGTSYENEGEINAIKAVVQCIQKANGFQEYMAAMPKDEDKEIGIITFYGPQKTKIENTFYGHLSKAQKRQFDLHKYDNEFNIPLRINTVDRFQGMERNILIVSTVRSNKQVSINDKGQKTISDNNNLGFARELQRINVAFSRAKRLLIVVGNQKHFAKHKMEYAESIRVMKYKINVEQLKNLAK